MQASGEPTHGPIWLLQSRSEREFAAIGSRSHWPLRSRQLNNDDRSWDRVRDRPPAGPLSIKLKVNGEIVGEGQVPISAPLGFTANDCIGMALGSPVSLDYRRKALFRFNGSIACVHVE
jgi:hypothetical protein